MANLCQTTDVILALAAGGRAATPDQVAALSAAVSAASGLAVRFCNRDFIRQTYDEQYEPDQDGNVWLRQMPVNFLTRCAAGRSGALSVRCTLTIARATVSVTPGTLTTDPPVGITLTSINAGVATTAMIPFAGNPSIGALATAISAVSGWAASAEDWAAGLPCSDLVGNHVALPALGSAPYGGSDLSAYASDVPARLDRSIGRLSLPSVELASSERVADPSWWPEVGGVSGDRVTRGKVRVVYDAGFDVVPPPVVQGTVLIAIMLLDRWSLDGTLQSESLGNTSFTSFSPELLAAIPRAAVGYLLPYRIMR